MRFYILASSFFLFSLPSKSQVQLSVFAGPQTSTANYKALSAKQETSNKYGFQLGMGAKIPFENQLFFSPAAFYSMKGYKVVYNQFLYPPGPEALDNNTTFHTFETAFLLQYDFSSRPNHVFIKAGPSLDFQLFGKEKFKTATGMVDRKLPWGFDKYGQFSANALLHLGYEMSNGFFVFGQYTYGLASINNADKGPRIKHRAAGISIGKYISRSK